MSEVDGRKKYVDLVEMAGKYGLTVSFDESSRHGGGCIAHFTDGAGNKVGSTGFPDTDMNSTKARRSSWNQNPALLENLLQRLSSASMSGKSLSKLALENGFTVDWKSVGEGREGTFACLMYDGAVMAAPVMQNTTGASRLPAESEAERNAKVVGAIHEACANRMRHLACK